MILTIGKMTRNEDWYGPMVFKNEKHPLNIGPDKFLKSSPQMRNVDTGFFVVDEFYDLLYGSMVPRCWLCRCKRMDIYSFCLARTEVSIRSIDVSFTPKFNNSIVESLYNSCKESLFTYETGSFETFRDGICVGYNVMAEFVGIGDRVSDSMPVVFH